MNKLSEYFNKNEHTLFEKEKSVTKPRKSSSKSQKSRKSTTMKHAEIRAF